MIWLRPLLSKESSSHPWQAGMGVSLLVHGGFYLGGEKGVCTVVLVCLRYEMACRKPCVSGLGVVEL